MATRLHFTTRMLQGAMWQRFHAWHMGWLAPRRDGKPGPATARGVWMMKRCLGYNPHSKVVQKNKYKADNLFYRRVHRPTWRHGLSAIITPRMFFRGRAFRKKVRRDHAANDFAANVAAGVTRFDGVPCPIWLAKKVAEVRKAGRWKGRLVSGWRDPKYSESLCYNMCGRPSCPGKCAGRASNHSGVWYPRGAIDVSDYWTFRNECSRLGNGLRNGMPSSDPVHFSVSGF